jgi:hypothetical protein
MSVDVAERRLVAFYVDEHNRVLPHAAFRGQTRDDMYFGVGDAIPAALADGARRARLQANRSVNCDACPTQGHIVHTRLSAAGRPLSRE